MSIYRTSTMRVLRTARAFTHDYRWLAVLFALAFGARLCIGWYRLGPDFDFGDTAAGPVADSLIAGHG